MKELSLNILDVAKNSVTAGATKIGILVEETPGRLTITITDNGCGMTPEFVRQVFRFQKRVIADRLRFPAVALPVNARQRIGDEEIFQELAHVAARNRAGILLAVRDSDHVAAAGDGAGGILRPALEPGADNAADIGSSAERTLGEAAADRRVAKPRNAADIAAVFTFRASEAAAVCDQPEVHSAADRAGKAVFGADRAVILAVQQDGPQRNSLSGSDGYSIDIEPAMPPTFRSP